jgi:hypothetical protein
MPTFIGNFTYQEFVQGLRQQKTNFLVKNLIEMGVLISPFL